MSEQGAKQGAKNVMKYWHELGYKDVRAWPERVPRGKSGFVWGVRSNLKNGLPQ